MNNIILYKVGINLNRVYRTCEFFGFNNLQLCKCEKSFIKGNLFKAEGQVNISTLESLPEDHNTIYFETDGNVSIYDIDLSKYSNFVFGGESNDLPKNKTVRCVIPKIGKISGLTVESAVSIILNEYRRQEYAKNNSINE